MVLGLGRWQQGRKKIFRIQGQLFFGSSNKIIPLQGNYLQIGDMKPGQNRKKHEPRGQKQQAQHHMGSL